MLSRKWIKILIPSSNFSFTCEQFEEEYHVKYNSYIDIRIISPKSFIITNYISSNTYVNM